MYQVQRKWQPPLPDILKINIDGSLQHVSKTGAWGFIIRNHEGMAVLAGARNLAPVHDALLAETMACKHALEAAEHVGISQVELETYSTQLREAITSSTRDLSIGGGLFTDIRSLQENFNCSQVCNAHRSCNSSVHELASMGMS
jgi:ribonuclease HI